MRLLKDSDYRTFEQLCGLSQAGMKKTLGKYLHNKYKTIIETKDYICAEGDIPIALVAHMDTVFPMPAKEVYYDRVKNVIWSPEGLGADDRAGIFAILQILKKGLRPHIILTTDEEKGAVGASILAQEDCPFKDLRYIVQLDRRNSCDCVFYDCDNPAFTEYIENFGFVEAIGSFSDISMICPAWKIAGVNLSIGYRDEHSISETLNVGHLLSTIDKVTKMLQETKIPTFEYIPCTNRYKGWYHFLPNAKIDNTHCKCCHKEFQPDELIPVKDNSHLGLCHYCIDCISDKVEWCSCCGEAFELDPKCNLKICEDCFYDSYYRNY